MSEQNFYVTKTGNDANDGSSWADADAFLTTQHAADNANPTGGTPIYIHTAAGTYAEQVDVDTYAGTDEDNKIIYDGDVENDSGDGATRPIIDGGDSRQYGFKDTGKNYIDIVDFEIKEQYHATSEPCGILMHTVDYGSIKRCKIHDITGKYPEGINIYRGCWYQVYNNIIYDVDATTSGGQGLGILSGESGALIYNNTVFGIKNSGGAGVGVISACIEGYITTDTYLENGKKNFYVKNNILHDCDFSQISLDTNFDTYYTDGWASDYNNLYKDTGTYTGATNTSGTLADTYSTLSDWQTASSQDANSIEADPLYVNEAGKDFHITDTESPCVGVGVDLSTIFTDDYDGDTRVASHWDIGADRIYSVVPFVRDNDGDYGEGEENFQTSISLSSFSLSSYSRTSYYGLGWEHPSE